VPVLLLSLLLLLTLRNRFGMMGTSGWDARRMVESGEEEEAEEEDDVDDDETEDAARVGTLDVEVVCSETEGRRVFAAVEFDVEVDSDLCERWDGQCRCCMPTCGADAERRAL
jgi:hypothetical protein